MIILVETTVDHQSILKKNSWQGILLPNENPDKLELDLPNPKDKLGKMTNKEYGKYYPHKSPFVGITDIVNYTHHWSCIPDK